VHQLVAKFTGLQILGLQQFLKIKGLALIKTKYFIASNFFINITFENTFSKNALEKVNVK
jgi:hypothetical protein